MPTRKHVHEIELPVQPERVFAVLHTPSAIRAWWNAARAIVLAQEGGVCAAAWGEHEDDPDYLTVARMQVFDPPRRILFTDYQYYAKRGPLPFQANFTTEFTVEARPHGSLLRVSQDGFPCEPIADEFYAGCEVGWRNTFEGIQRFLAEV
ncbi:SRPBCC domain-containing protein [candidate division KSB1 bacterium]|nr:SRPBCC domain-containing protein [candidate division KSB1 bacterium]